MTPEEARRGATQLLRVYSCSVLGVATMHMGIVAGWSVRARVGCAVAVFGGMLWGMYIDSS